MNGTNKTVIHRCAKDFRNQSSTVHAQRRQSKPFLRGRGLQVLRFSKSIQTEDQPRKGTGTAQSYRCLTDKSTSHHFRYWQPGPALGASTYRGRAPRRVQQGCAFGRGTFASFRCFGRRSGQVKAHSCLACGPGQDWTSRQVGRSDHDHCTAQAGTARHDPRGVGG